MSLVPLLRLPHVPFKSASPVSSFADCCIINEFTPILSSPHPHLHLPSSISRFWPRLNYCISPLYISRIHFATAANQSNHTLLLDLSSGHETAFSTTDVTSVPSLLISRLLLHRRVTCRLRMFLTSAESPRPQIIPLLEAPETSSTHNRFHVPECCGHSNCPSPSSG